MNKDRSLKVSASLASMKTLSDGRISWTLISPPNEMIVLMDLFRIKSDGDDVSLSAKRKKKIIPKEDHAKKEQNNKKPIRRVSRYPYRDR